MEQTLVIFSGGQDSTTCLLQAIAERGAANVHTISFSYGQRNKREAEYAESLAKELGVASHKTVIANWFNGVANNALLDKTKDIEEIKGKTDNFIIDGRNAFFLLTAAVYAKGLGVRDIIIGSCKDDRDVAPDGREEFFASMEQTLRLAMDWPFRVLMPLRNLSKEQEWELAAKLGMFEFVRKKSISCYEGIPGYECGKCHACRSRAAGLDAYLRNHTPGMGSSNATNA